MDDDQEISIQIEDYDDYSDIVVLCTECKTLFGFYMENRYCLECDADGHTLELVN